MSVPTCVAYVREALGDPDISVEIENVQRWSASAEYAERLRVGRVFVAGDAAHVMPPTGGFGGNAGIQDGYDLAWKLAHVLDGRADEALLETFDAERQPVGALTTEQAYTRYVLRLDPALGKDDLMDIVDEATVELGYRYRSAAISGESTGADAVWEDPRAPSARPGFRAPHVPITVAGIEQSALDLFGRSFVLLAGSDGEGWCSEAQAVGGSLGVPVSPYRMGTDVSDAAGELEAIYGTGPEGAVLVRPDGFVCWRSAAPHTDTAGELAAALSAALGRDGSAAAN